MCFTKQEKSEMDDSFFLKILSIFFFIQRIKIAVFSGGGFDPPSQRTRTLRMQVFFLRAPLVFFIFSRRHYDFHTPVSRTFGINIFSERLLHILSTVHLCTGCIPTFGLPILTVDLLNLQVGQRKYGYILMMAEGTADRNVF